MEPGLRGREDRAGPRRGPGRRRAAMEPGLRGREDGGGMRSSAEVGDAAMEPGLRGREDRRAASPAARPRAGRYGARPSGPGRRAARRGRGRRSTPGRYGARPSGPGRPNAMRAQCCQFSPPLWSPAFGAGKTRRRSAPTARRPRRPLWSPAFGAGKTLRVVVERQQRRAPLWSPAFGAGKTARRSRSPRRPHARRYGARPSGPGRQPAGEAAVPGPRRAAMEPGLRGREDPSVIRSRTSRSIWPLWSPAFGAGKTDRGGERPREPGQAAMEPGLRGREDGSTTPTRGAAPGCRYGARPSGPGRRHHREVVAR